MALTVLPGALLPDRPRGLTGGGVALLALIAFSGDAGAASGAPCRLALALAMDVSRSVDEGDFALQIDGTVAALQDKAVRAAFLEGDGPVALAIYQWSGASFQEGILDWTMIDRPEALDAAVAAVRQTVRPKPQNTALGIALDYGLDLIDAAPPCTRSVLDIAGDGRNNEGPAPGRIYGQREIGAVTVNALAIGEHESGLAAHFRAEVIRGAGAFVEIADKQVDFPKVFRRKLLRELVDQVALVPEAEEAPVPVRYAP